MVGERVEELEAGPWGQGIEEVHRRIGARFYRSKPRWRPLAYLKGLMSPVERKNWWSAAGGAGQPFGSAQEVMPRPTEYSACCTTTYGMLA